VYCRVATPEPNTRVVNRHLKQLSAQAVRTVVRATMIALFLTAAFAIAPALGTAADAAPNGAARPVTEAILIATALMVLVVGTAMARWSREETS
jgi:hypothetical protein